MAKKRKQAEQSATLHDFFSKGGPSSAKKPKLRTNDHKPLKSSHTAFHVSSEDIIIIESDNEDAHKEKVVLDVGSSFSDIEVVDGPSTARTKDGQDGRKCSSSDRDTNMRTRGNMHAMSPTREEDSDPFGRLVLLRSDASDVTGDTLSETNPFGAPILLRGEGHMSSGSKLSDSGLGVTEDPLPPRELHPRTKCSPPETLATAAFEADVACPPSNDEQDEPVLQLQNPLLGGTDDPLLNADEWGTGDDEIDTTEADVADFAVQDNREADAAESCPVCGRFLEAMAVLVCICTLAPTASSRC